MPGIDWMAPKCLPESPRLIPASGPEAQDFGLYLLVIGLCRAGVTA